MMLYMRNARYLMLLVLISQVGLVLLAWYYPLIIALYISIIMMVHAIMGGRWRGLMVALICLGVQLGYLLLVQLLPDLMPVAATWVILFSVPSIYCLSFFYTAFHVMPTVALLASMPWGARIVDQCVELTPYNTLTYDKGSPARRDRSLRTLVRLARKGSRTAAARVQYLFEQNKADPFALAWLACVHDNVDELVIIGTCCSLSDSVRAQAWTLLAQRGQSPA